MLFPKEYFYSSSFYTIHTIRLDSLYFIWYIKQAILDFSTIDKIHRTN